MGKFFAIVFVAVMLSACTEVATHDLPSNAIVFTETNASGIVIRKLSFVLTKHPVRTCQSGQWYMAKILSNPNGYAKSAAYSFVPGRLEVLLVNGPCDSYNSYIGKLVDHHFTGSHIWYGLGNSKTLGHVVGTYYPQ